MVAELLDLQPYSVAASELALDNVMSVLQASPLVKKLPARKNELLHAFFFRDDSLARTKGEPIAWWLVRYNEQLGKLNRVDLDIVTSLPDAGWSHGRQN